MSYTDFDIYENDGIGKIEDAGVVVRGGGIDRYWSREGIDTEFKKFFDKNPKHEWLFDSNKALKHFNLRSIEFGNWMNQQDRANFLYASMLSLHHLAKVFRIKDNEIGMKGKISIALGARGQGQAAAHYERNPYAVINLTKTMGFGALAHEYAHAVDNIISFYTNSSETFVSGGRSTRKGYNPQLAKSNNWFEAKFEDFFNRLYYTRTGKETKFLEAINQKEEYWQRRTEVWARTTEVYVHGMLKAEKIKDHFLVNSSYNNKAYPSPELLKNVSQLITHIYKRAFEIIAKEKPLQGIEAIDIEGAITGYDGFQKTLKKNASVDDTLKNMKRIALRDTYQVKSLATQLKANTVKETARNIWNYLRTNTRYKLDKKGIEQLRTPARGLVDGNKGLTDRNFGIDCDDYTILISALLLTMGITHEYRVTAYKEVGRFQHIYPVAFDSLGNEFVIDVVPEIPHFNYEAKPIIDIKKIPMELHELSGASDTLDQNEIASDLLDDLNAPFSLSGMDDYDESDQDIESSFLSGFTEVEHPEDADIVLNGTEDAINLIKGGLLAEIHKARKALLIEKQEPTTLSQVINVDREISIMDNILDVWRSDARLIETVEKAIVSGSSYANFYKAILIGLEKLNAQDLRGFDDDMDEPIYLARVDMNEFSLAQLLEDDNDTDDLGDLGSRKSRRARRRARRRRRRKRGGFFKKIFKGIGKGIKKVVKAVIRFNPATIVIRAAIRLVLKINLFKIASKLIYGYLTEEQAKAQKMDLNEWRKVVRAKNRGEKFYKKLGGKTSKFKKAIIRGKAAKKTGLQLSGDLGAAATGTTTAAASGFLVFIKAILKKINFGALFKRKKSNNTGVMPPDDTTNIQFTNDLPNTNSNSFKTSDTNDASNSDADKDKNKTFGQKVKEFLKKHKKKFIGGFIALVIIFIAIGFYKNQQKKRKKRSLAGIKAARTRARNRRKTPTLKGAPRQRALPPRQATRAVAGVRKRKTSNASRLKAMHTKAKQLQKKHPKTKYSTLLKRAAKMI